MRDAVAELGLGLVRLERQRHRMTEIFTDSPSGQARRACLSPARRAARTGAIHDIGYRHYDGPRLGASYIRRSLFVETLRGAFGLGRSARSKVMPFLLLAVMVLPAWSSGIVTSYVGLDELPVGYTEYVITCRSRSRSSSARRRRR